MACLRLLAVATLFGLAACHHAEAPVAVVDAEFEAALLQRLSKLAVLSEPLIEAAQAGDLEARLQLHEVDAQVWRAGLVPLRRAFGVRAQPLDEVNALLLGLGAGSGALLTEVIPGGPAAACGLQVGDCIMRVNGHVLNFAGPRASDLRHDALNLEILRPGGTPAVRTLPCLVPRESLEMQIPDARAEAEAIMRRALQQVLREGGSTLIPPAPIRDGG
ncbi:MAG: hypothetical protein EXS14_06425 [Planctomycetes bacterium]|nr:hypothetical protein [Planctomycetota bacterium]